MKSRMVCVVSCGVCFALFGCASEQRRFAGFLRDHLILMPHPTSEGGLISWNRGIAPEHLRAVLAEPVGVTLEDPNEENLAEPDDVAAFCTFVADELLTAIGKHAAIVTEPGPNEQSNRKDAYVASNRPPRGH